MPLKIYLDMHHYFCPYGVCLHQKMLKVYYSLDIEETWGQPAFQFISEVFSSVVVRTLCRPLKFFHSKLGKPCFNEDRFVNRGIVMLGQVGSSWFQ